MLDYIHHVCNKGLRVPDPFCTCVGCVFCAALLFSRFLSHIFLFFVTHYVCACVWAESGLERVKVCWSLENIHADPPILENDFFCEYGTSLHLQRSSAMQMYGNSGCVWDVSFQCSRYTAVGGCKNRWWHWGGSGSSICHCVLPGVDTPYVHCFEEVEYKTVLQELFAAMQ